MSQQNPQQLKSKRKRLQKKKKKKKKNRTFKDYQGNIKRRKKRTGEIFEEIITEKIAQIDVSYQTTEPGAQKPSGMTNAKRTTPEHIILKLENQRWSS